MTLHFWVLDARSSRCFRNASLRVLLHWNVAQIVRRIVAGFVSSVGSYARQMLRILTGCMVALAQILARLTGWSDHMMREHLFEGGWGAGNVTFGGAEFYRSGRLFTTVHRNISCRGWWVACIISSTYLWGWPGQTAWLLLKVGGKSESGTSGESRGVHTTFRVSFLSAGTRLRLLMRTTDCRDLDKIISKKVR